MTIIEQTVIATTLMIKKAWVKPFQTVEQTCQRSIYGKLWGLFVGSHTVSVVMEVCELIAPLGQNAQCVLEESDNNQEAADGREVPIKVNASSIAAPGARECRNSAL